MRPFGLAGPKPGPSVRLTLFFLVVTDHLPNDEIQEFLCEIRVQIGAFCQIFEPCNLRCFAGRIRGRKPMLCLETTHSLRVLEPLAQRIDEDRVQTIDRGTMLLQKLGGTGHGV